MVLAILNTFASYAGLKVNWTKSSILPLDSGATVVADLSLPLRWVSQLTYLGVQITAEVEDYMALNLLPLVTLLKQRIQAWKNLPFSLIGKINLIKMKVLPVILYFLHHAPLRVPKYYFERLDGLVSTFLWSLSPPVYRLKGATEPLPLLKHIA